MKMKQAKTLFLNRAQLYTALGALRPSEIRPEADGERICSIADFPVIPRGPSVPLRRFAAIPFKFISQTQAAMRNSWLFSFCRKDGDGHAVSGF